MADTQIAIPGLEDHEESVRIAVKALGDMRNGSSLADASRTLPPLSIGSSSSPLSNGPATPPLASHESPQATSTSPAFVSRVSHFPIVNSALRAYEQGKASSRVVKYGAEIVESSVKTISRPVIDRLPVNVNQLDEFACRQLDRLDRYRRPSTGETSVSPSRMVTSPDTSLSERDRDRPKLKTKTLDGSVMEDDRGEDTQNPANRLPSSPTALSRRARRGGEKGVPTWLEASSPFVAPPPPPPDSRSSTPTQNGEDSRSERSQAQSRQPGNGEEQQVARRSRWQAVLLEAGGLSAALSEESMRKLQYCLQWLQYAAAHIDAQILILRDFTASLQPLPSDNLSTARRPPISDEHMRKLTNVRRDIVHTIRQVVDVVSKYAGGALPEPARGRVRGFILKLPQRWANKAKAGGGVVAGSTAVGGNGSVPAAERETVAAASWGTGAMRQRGQRRAAQRERGAGAAESGLRSGPPSRAPSPSSSSRVPRSSLVRHGEAEGTDGNVSTGTALVAAQRILVLATESLDMMRGVTGVVKDSLDRADAWVGRLRTVGIQRGAQEGEDTDSEFEFRHRRRGSSQSQFDDQEMPSPFLSGSSTAWGSSIPSTPGGPCTPGFGYTSTSAYNYNGSASPGAIPIASMTIASGYSTPKSVDIGLPEEEEVAKDMEMAKGSISDGDRKPQAGQDDVRVVTNGDSRIEADEKGLGKMDVDVGV